MALEIFKLVGSIFVDNEEANNSIQKTDNKAKSVGETLAAGVGKAAKWGTAIVGGATAAVSAVAGLANKTAEQADIVDKASQRMGVDAEEYQKLAYAAGMSGVEMSTLETAAKTLQQKLPDADISNVISELAAMTDEEERTAKATELLGSKAAYALAPLLNAGADGINDLKNEAQALGMVMSNETVTAGATFGDTLSAIKQSLGGMVNSIGASVMPTIQTVLSLVKDNLPKIQQLFERITPVISSLLENLLPPLIDLAEQIFPILFDLIEQLLPPVTEIVSALLPVIVNLLKMLLPPLVQIITAVLPILVDVITPLISLLQPLIELLQPILELVMELLKPLLDLIGVILPPLVQIFSEIYGAYLPLLSKALSAISGVISKVFGTAIKAISPIIEGVGAVFSAVWEGIKAAWSGVTAFFSGIWEGIKKVFSGVQDFFEKIFGGLVDIIKAPINFIIDALNVLIGALNKISFDIPSWIPAIGGKKFGFDIAKIQHLREGGDVDGDLFVANEDEPELIATSHDSTVVVNNKQIIAAVVNGVAAAVSNVMQNVVNAINEKQNEGDIYIPIYLDGNIYDEVLVTAKNRINFRSNGRADV